MRSINRVFGMAGVLAVLQLGIYSDQAGAEESVAKSSSLSAFQVRSLTTAFEIATAIPTKPHIKDRSRAQEKVILGCLELDQPERALAYVKQVDNWRRALGLANIALYDVQHGITNNVESLLKEADGIAETVTSQEWRRDLVLARIKAARDAMNKSPESSESHSSDETYFEEQMKSVDELFKIGNLDTDQTAMLICCSLYSDYYSTEVLRTKAEQTVRERWTRVPCLNRIDVLKSLAEIALKNDDAKNALRIVGDAAAIVDEKTWPLEYELPPRSDLAALRYRAGDEDRAIAELMRAKALFDNRAEEVVNIDRTETLLPLAEAFKKVGHLAEAKDTYSLAIKSAVLNANSRPRAEDLSAICLSMALNNFEPSDAIWQQLEELKSKLGDPW